MNRHIALPEMAQAIENMGDEELYREISLVFANRVEEMLSDIQAALDAGDMPEAMRFAHSLKGNCASLGASPLQKMCFELELACKAADVEKAKNLFRAIRPELMLLKVLLLDL